MQVKELRSVVEKTAPKFITSSFSMLEYSPGSLKVKGTDLDLKMSDRSKGKFSSFLTIPKTFLPKITDELQVQVVNHFLKSSPNSEVLLSYTANNELRNAYPGSAAILPPKMMVDSIEKVFNEDDQVRDLNFNDGFKVSIITDSLTTEPRVGDITKGGVRIASTIGEAPKVASFLERLVCSNGMVVPVTNASLTLRGKTVNEIIEEMEVMASYVLGSSTNDALNNWKHLSTINAPDASQLIHRFSNEYGIGSRMQNRLLDRVSELEGNTYYDVVNLITSMQHEEGVSEAMRENLQLIGGQIVNTRGGHRCNSCYHSLD